MPICLEHVVLQNYLPIMHASGCSGAAVRSTPQKSQEASAYELTYTSTPFSFTVNRAGKTGDSPVFSTAGQRLVFKVQPLWTPLILLAPELFSIHKALLMNAARLLLPATTDHVILNIVAESATKQAYHSCQIHVLSSK